MVRIYFNKKKASGQFDFFGGCGSVRSLVLNLEKGGKNEKERKAVLSIFWQQNRVRKGSRMLSEKNK